MKLRLPSILLSAIVALQTACPLFASTTLVSGISYDVGKISYSSATNPEYPTGVTDTEYCWVASGSNIVQYWQDTYKEYHDEGEELISGTSARYDNPYGTDYLNVYHEALSNALLDKTGSSSQFINWWMHGEAVQWDEWEEKPDSSGALKNLASGHYDSVFANTTYCTKQMTYISPFSNSLEDITNFLREAFSTRGQAVQLDTFGNAHHAISCWGYETNSEGIVTALYLTDSDDNYFGAFRMTVEEVDAYWYTQVIGYPATENGPAFVMNTEDEFGYYGFVQEDTNGEYRCIQAGIIGLTYIDTESATENGTSIAKPVTTEEGQPASSVTSGSTILINTLLKGTTIIEGEGITVGDGTRVVILSGESGHSLTLNGKETATTAGISTEQGSMISLEQLSVAGYNNVGLDLHSKTYIHDGYLNVTSNNNANNDGGGIYTDSHLDIGSNSNYDGKASINISDNKAQNGGGLYVSGGNADLDAAYPTKIIVSLHDNEEVQINGNNAANSGGGVYNDSNAIVKIRGNQKVQFSGNGAKNGNDIYNAEGGTVVIADNNHVSFESNTNGVASVTNDGKLYLAARDNQDITFKGTKLEGKGTTYIGTDTLGGEFDGTVQFTGENNELSFAGSKQREYDSDKGEYLDVKHAAELTNLTVSAVEIIGAANNIWTKASSLSYADISAVGMLTMSNVTLNSTDTITSGKDSVITLDSVAITLSSSDMDTSLAKSFSLTGMFNGDFTVNNNLYFDASNVENFTMGEEDQVYVLIGTESIQNIEKAKLWLGNGYYSDFSYFDSDNGIVVFAGLSEVPEPTTGTLGLLALAGLCGRRRRR